MGSRNNELSIDKSERKSIINDNLKEFSEELSSYKMNSEMELAWIVNIIPPDTAHKKATEGKVSIEFMLPDESTFWRSFTTPRKRWDTDNEFIQFMVSHDIYSPDNLVNLLGKTVDIKYNEIAHEWELDIPELDNNGNNNKQTKTVRSEENPSMKEDVLQTIKIMVSTVLFLIGFSALIVFRQYGIPFILLFFGSSYLFYKSFVNS